MNTGSHVNDASVTTIDEADLSKHVSGVKLNLKGDGSISGLYLEDNFGGTS